MVRLLHTADVHLARDRPERQAALASVLELGEAEGVDVVTIGGDLFDSDRDSQALRPELRQLFADRPYDVLAIPGNHDAAAFGSDLHYGEAFDPVVAEPFDHAVVGDLRLTGVPYPSGDPEEVLLALGERDPWPGPEAIVLHCSLEAPFQHASTGDEAGGGYFPVTRGALADLDADYLLAGHYHSAHRLELAGGATFVYPGSPASVTRAETGPRTAALVDTAAGDVTLPQLPSFHYDELELTVTPGTAEVVLAEIEDWVAERRDRNVEATIRVMGHTEMDEAAFDEALTAASGDVAVDNRTTGVAAVLDHPLFREFEAKLAARDLEDDRLEAAVRERAIRIFSELSAGGRLT